MKDWAVERGELAFLFFICVLFSLSNLSYPIGGTSRPSFVDISLCCWSIISRREGIGFAVAPITIGGTLSIKLDVPKEVEKYFIIKKKVNSLVRTSIDVVYDKQC